MEDWKNRDYDPVSEFDIIGQARQALERPVITDPSLTSTPASRANLPEPVNLGLIWSSLPEVAPVLIDGVLRQGHKMIISAPSKAGKSFALMELAIAIAEGMNWLGSRCTQGRVLYINMEIDDASCYHRFQTIYNEGLKMNIGNNVDNITVWGLRGYSMPLSRLAPIIIEQAKKMYKAIIIDPLYKVMDGDENSNSDVGYMVSQFDRIARETGASVIYAHHFAKGVGGDRAAIDRGAGAGTFARDPDAILTMTPLDIADPGDPSISAWRMEYVLREFPNKEPVSFWWKYPLHQIEETLNDVQVETSETKKERVRNKIQAEKRKQQIEDTITAVEKIQNENGEFLISDFMREYAQYEDITRMTAVKRLEQAGYVDKKPERKGFPAYWYRPANL